MWPNFNDDQWMKVKITLKDLILLNYAKKNNGNILTLTS